VVLRYTFTKFGNPTSIEPPKVIFAKNMTFDSLVQSCTFWVICSLVWNCRAKILYTECKYIK